MWYYISTLLLFLLGILIAFIMGFFMFGEKWDWRKYAKKYAKRFLILTIAVIAVFLLIVILQYSW